MTAIILAGGEHRRMGTNKALLKVGEKRVIDILVDKLRCLFDEVIISTNSFAEFEYLNLRMVRDLLPGRGSLGGIYSGLKRSSSFVSFVVACDMPVINPQLIEHLKTYTAQYDIVIPMSRNGLEPLHSFYSKNCIAPIERQLKEDNLKIIDLFPQVRVLQVSWEEVARVDPEGKSFRNINTVEDYESLLSSLM